MAVLMISKRAVVATLLSVGPAAFAQNSAAAAQSAAVTLSGTVTDPTGAVIAGALLRIVSLAQLPAQPSAQPGTPPAAAPKEIKTDATGRFSLALPAGVYEVHVASPGFDGLDRTVTLTASAVRLDAQLSISTESVQVDVPSENSSTASDENKNAMVFGGKQMDALSADDSTFQQEVLAMAGGTGEGGAELYVDGFSGGRFPPKDTIREIRINQNPFSAQYNGFGVGRVEISTKPGSEKVHGSFYASGNPDVLNARNPFTGIEPPYYSYVTRGDVSGPLGKKTSIFGSGAYVNQQTNAVVNAVNGDGSPLSTAVAAPQVTSTLSLRLERQLTANNTLVTRYEYNRASLTNSGVGLLVLPSEGVNSTTTTQTFQAGNTQVIGSKVVSETRFQFARTAVDQTPVDRSPTIIVQGSFSGGGAPAQVLADAQNNFEFQQYLSITAGKHFIRTGARLRLYEESNVSTANYNGQYIFPTLAAYQARTPSLFSLTSGQSRATLLTSDLEGYAEDEWKARPNVTITYGLRLESQQTIPNRFNPAPRAGISWAIGQTAKHAPIVTLRFNAGMFYGRFAQANILTSIRQNGVSQQSFFVTNPGFYPAIPAPTALNTTAPTPYSISPNLRVAYDSIAGVIVERSIGKMGSISATYLAIRGVHQYDSHNVNAPLPGSFDPSNPLSTGVRPFGGTQNVYQFASDGIEKAQTVFVNGNLRPTKWLSLFGFYVARRQTADTSGSTMFPSQPYNVSADFGPSGLGFRAIGQRFFFDSTVKLPFGFSSEFFAGVLSSQRFNITTGTDLNGDTQYNDRPAFATNPGPASVLYRTSYGTFDANPQPGEAIIPYNYARGPRLAFTELGLGRDFKFGPRPAPEAPAPGAPAAKGPVARPDPKYALNFTIDAANLLNHVNAGPPVGVLSSPLFGRSNSLNSFFAPSSSANRAIFLQTSFHF